MKTHALCSADTLSTVLNRIRMHDSSVCLLFLFLKFVSDRRKSKEFNYYIFEVKKYRNMKQESLKEVLFSKVLVFMPCSTKASQVWNPSCNSNYVWTQSIVLQVVKRVQREVDFSLRCNVEVKTSSWRGSHDTEEYFTSSYLNYNSFLWQAEFLERDSCRTKFSDRGFELRLRHVFAFSITPPIDVALLILEITVYVTVTL